uniref:PUA domain-containing protein n=1 Tax=Ciona savignyi TaxID=51511 RepID=H2Y4E8_CIOSA
MDILIPPLFTTLRVNESKDVDFVKEELEIKLKKAYSTNGIEPVAPLIFEHSQLKSTLIIPTTVQDPPDCYKHVVVDYPCGMAVLRGADVFAPGVLSVPTGIQAGDKVAVFADVSKS